MEPVDNQSEEAPVSNDGFFRYNETIPENDSEYDSSEEPVDDGQFEDEPSDGGDDKSVEAYRRLQSDRDKLRHQYDTLESKYKEMEGVKPLVDLIQSDPELLGIIEKRIKGEPIARAQAPVYVPESAPLPERPVKPERPKNYDADDAVSDPRSESFQYEQQLREYYDQMLEYQDAQMKHLSTERQREQAMAKQQQQRAQVVQRIRQEAINDFGATSAEADAYIQWASAFDDSKPENRRLIFNAWKMTKSGKNPKLTAAEQRIQQVRADTRRLQTGRTVTGANNTGSAKPKEPGFITPRGRRSLI